MIWTIHILSHTPIIHDLYVPLTKCSIPKRARYVCVGRNVIYLMSMQLHRTSSQRLDICFITSTDGASCSIAYRASTCINNKRGRAFRRRHLLSGLSLGVRQRSNVSVRRHLHGMLMDQYRISILASLPVCIVSESEVVIVRGSSNGAVNWGRFFPTSPPVELCVCAFVRTRFLRLFVAVQGFVQVRILKRFCCVPMQVSVDGLMGRDCSLETRQYKRACCSMFSPTRLSVSSFKHTIHCLLVSVLQ